MTVTYPIVAPLDGDDVDVEWANDITDSANDHETLLQTHTTQIASVANRIIRRGSRPTNSSSTTTEIGVLRLAGAAMTVGHFYAVWTNNVPYFTTVANDIVSMRIRYTIDGSTPGTGSTLLIAAPFRVTDASVANGPTPALRAIYVPTSSLTFTALLTVARASGGGSVALLGGPIDLCIEDLGTDPTDSGIDI